MRNETITHVKKYCPATALWLVGMAANVSGYQNQGLAIAMIGLAGLLLAIPSWDFLKRWALAPSLRQVDIEPLVSLVIGAALITASLSLAPIPPYTTSLGWLIIFFMLCLAYGLIWVTAALGMAIGYHNYPIAIVVSIMVVITLFVLEPVQRYINNLHRVKDYRIKTVLLGKNFREEFESFFLSKRTTFRCMKIIKEENDAIYLYRISSPDRNYDAVNNFLLHHAEVKSFEV